MKINRLETHDRLVHFKKDQEANVFQGAEDCLKKNKLSLSLQEKSHYIYIFAHPRTADDGVNKRMLWQPRLTKPVPQTNSYLFRAVSKTDVVEVLWLLPPKELWNQYRQGYIAHDPIVLWSINEYETNRKNMGKAEYDDLTDEKIKKIYNQIVKNKENIGVIL